MEELAAARADAAAARAAAERRYEARLAAHAGLAVARLNAARRSRGKLAARGAATRARSEGVNAEIDAVLARLRAGRAGGDSPAGENPALEEETAAAAALADAVARYRRQVDAMLPAWQAEMEQHAYRRLRRLQRAEVTLKKRREAAKDAFEKEKRIRALVADKEHDVDLLRMQEQAEQAHRNRERARLEREAHERALQRQAAEPSPQGPETTGRAPLPEALSPPPQTPQRGPASHKSTPVPDLITPLPAAAVRRRLRTQFPDLLDDTQDPGEKKGARDAGDSPSARTPPQLTRAQPPSPPPTRPYGTAEGHTVPPSPTFELSYDWQSVPLGKTLPVQTEQRLNMAKGLGRMARIPNAWNLEVLLAENGRRFEVRVQQNDEIGLVAREVATLAFGRATPLTLTCNGKVLTPERTVAACGSALFTGQVLARQHASDTQPSERFFGDAAKPANETEHADTGAGRHRGGQVGGGGNGSGRRWDAIAEDLEALVGALRNPASEADLRASKHGLLEPEDDISASDTRQLKRELRARGRAVLDDEGISVDLVLQTLFSLLSVDAGGLLSLSLLGNGSMTTDAIRVGEALHKFHLSCRDGRERVWRILVNYWQWVIRERLVSREDLAAVFVKVLVPPGERIDGICAANIRWIVREFSSNEAPAATTTAAPDGEPWDRAGARVEHEDRRTQRQYSFDELLGGSPQAARRPARDMVLASSSEEEGEADDIVNEARQDDGDDDDGDDLLAESARGSELDASFLATAPARNNGTRLQRVLRDFEDDDEDDAEDLDRRNADVSVSRHDSAALDRFVARESETAGILGDAGDPDVVDDDEFDF